MDGKHIKSFHLFYFIHQHLSMFKDNTKRKLINKAQRKHNIIVLHDRRSIHLIEVFMKNISKINFVVFIKNSQSKKHLRLSST